MAHGAHRTGPFDVCFGLLDRHFAVEHVGLRFRDLGVLFGRVQTRQNVVLLDAIAMIGLELDDRRADFETDFGQHARFDGSKAENTDLNTAFGRRDANRKRQLAEREEDERTDRKRRSTRQRPFRSRLACQAVEPRPHAGHRLAQPGTM